jgi:hypothetical protein
MTNFHDATACGLLRGAAWYRFRGIREEEAEVGGVQVTVDPEATMHADLDTLLTTVYC